MRRKVSAFVKVEGSLFRVGEEFLNRFLYAVDSYFKTGETTYLESAALMARRGFKGKFFNEAPEVQLAAQMIFAEAEVLDNARACVHVADCPINRLCGANKLIERQMVDGNISKELSKASQIKLPYVVVEGCPLTPEGEREAARRTAEAMAESGRTSDDTASIRRGR